MEALPEPAPGCALLSLLGLASLVTSTAVTLLAVL
jgi:hypothetical protein